MKLDGNGDRMPDYWVWKMPRDQDVFNVTIEARLTSEDSQVSLLLRRRSLRPELW